jgi:exoribonuclease II
MNNAKLIQWLTEEQQKWELIIVAIGEKRMTQTGIHGDWTMRDVVTHLTVWQRNHIVKLEAIIAGQPDPASPWPSTLTTEDEINAWMYQAHRERTTSQVLDDAIAVHAQTMAFRPINFTSARMRSLNKFPRFPTLFASKPKISSTNGHLS